MRSYLVRSEDALKDSTSFRPNHLIWSFHYVHEAYKKKSRKSDISKSFICLSQYFCLRVKMLTFNWEIIDSNRWSTYIFPTVLICCILHLHNGMMKCHGCVGVFKEELFSEKREKLNGLTYMCVRVSYVHVLFVDDFVLINETRKRIRYK